MLDAQLPQLPEQLLLVYFHGRLQLLETLPDGKHAHVKQIFGEKCRTGLIIHVVDEHFLDVAPFLVLWNSNLHNWGKW